MMENQDLLLKLLCKILFSSMGFCTQYEIKLRNKSYITSYRTHDVSDIDVYGYMFDYDLSQRTVGAECKSGESNAIDELYKFLGIGNYYKLDKAYLIKSKIHQNARQLALLNRMSCLTEVEIRKLLLGLEIDIEKKVKVENAKYQKHLNYLKSYKSINEKLVDYVTLDYWNKDNWKNIHNILHILKQPAQIQRLFDEVTITEKYIHYYTAELFTLSLLKIISDAIILSFTDLENAFVACLYGGAENLNDKRKIHDAVNIATQQNEKFEPDWQSDLVNICTRFTQSTLASGKTINMIQDIYGNCFYGDKVKIDSKVIRKYPDLTRKFVQDIMHFLTKSCSLNENVFIDFMRI